MTFDSHLIDMNSITAGIYMMTEDFMAHNCVISDVPDAAESDSFHIYLGIFSLQSFSECVRKRGKSVLGHASVLYRICWRVSCTASVRFQASCCS